jgi:hypothetical protein
MASFKIAFITYKSIKMVLMSSTEGWQEGEAYLVVKELMKNTILLIMFQRLK